MQRFGMESETIDTLDAYFTDLASPKPTQPSIPIGQREDLVQQIKRIVGCIAHDADRGTVEVFKLIDSLAALSATPVDVGEGKPPA
jgi:hypothetical protein